MTQYRTIFVCWPDAYDPKNKRHVALWANMGTEEDLKKAQEYIANIDGRVLEYPFFDKVTSKQVRLDYEALLYQEALENIDHARNWFDTSKELE